MKYNPQIHHRQTIRLRGYDYSRDGAYFVTVCVGNRERLFGEVVDGVMRLNDAGRMIQSVWDDIPKFYPGFEIDAFQIMPNHIHGIIMIQNEPSVGADPCVCPDNGCVYHDDGRVCPNDDKFGVCPDDGLPDLDNSGRPLKNTGRPQGVTPTKILSLSDIIHRFKTLSTKRYTDGVKNNNWPPFGGKLWQRNYYEHIIRDETSLEKIRAYIIDNPHNWETDDLNDK